MRIAVAGKGGAGKTTISATLSRMAARAGARVVAIDADSNPNLATALGIEPDRARGAHPLPASLVSRRLDGAALTTPVAEVLAQHGVPGPDGIYLLAMGAPAHAGQGCLCSAHATVSAVLEDLAQNPAIVVVDMEASPEQLSRGTVRHTDVLLLIGEPYFRSLETVRRLAVLGTELGIAQVAVVANKVRTEGEAEAVKQFCRRHGLACWATVPWSDEVGAADLAGRALLDSAPESDAAMAIGRLATRWSSLDPTG